MKNQQSGFTLVEIAIVLVIIGLLLGGVLKGQELINQAKIKNVANDLNGLTAAIYGYQDRYKRLPGDDPGATRWTVAGTAIVPGAGAGNNAIAGTYSSTLVTDESNLFWAELRLAGFIQGPTDTLQNATSHPLNAAGGIVGVQAATAASGLGLTGLVICTGSLPAKIAQAVDSQFDDGLSVSGTVRALLETAAPTALGAAPAASYQDNGSNQYVLCKTI